MRTALLALGVSLVVSLIPAPAAAAAVMDPPATQPVASVPVTAVAQKKAGTASVAEVTGTPRVSWPKAQSAAVARGRAGQLPVTVAGSKAGEVEVAWLGHGPAVKAGLDGVLLTVAPADGKKTEAPVTLAVSYDGFRGAYGGDWASRLRLVELPACAATTPDKASCRAATPVRSSRNDVRAGTVTAEVDASGTYALAAAPSGPNGTFEATSLSRYGSWQVSEQTGAFTWSQPMRVPPVPGDLTPTVEASYNSASVDGRVATTNNQTSWVGEGWDLSPGFVERRYRGCAEDLGGNQGQTKTGDLCWAAENATVSFAGHSGPLVRDDATGTWRFTDDDGTRVEQLFGADNGDDNGEYWRLTTVDGVRYYFGLNRVPDGRPAANSAWTVPVAGNNPGEPCNAATYDASFCAQAWRWNLDYVVDPHGNTMFHTYAAETNRYGRNLGKSAVDYVRGGTLTAIDYGTRSGDTGTPPARVLFATADRCLPGADCTQRTPASWPDVPWDQNCTASTCPNTIAPTFWSTKRLTAVTTQVWNGTAYRDVERWTFEHSYPDPGDKTSPAMWLKAIGHTGLAGTAVSTPAVTFEPDPNVKANRVDSATDGFAPMNRNRIHAINTESGGVVNVNYAPANCAPGALPAVDTNTARCFPVRWTPELVADPIDDWFHKYVVASVGLVDRVGGAPTQFTSYDYVGGAAWAYDDDPVTPQRYRTWTDWRGYEKVRVRTGNPADPGDKAETATTYQYYRGMDGDRLKAGGAKSVRITDTQGVSTVDAKELAGFLREEIVTNGPGGAEVRGAVYDPWVRGPTATQGTAKAFFVEVGAERGRTPLSSGGVRRTEVRTTYDEYGLPTQVDDRGDVADAADDRCTRTTYARNTASWLLELPSREHTVGVACATTPVYPRDAISDVRTYYDGGAFGTAPAKGDATKVESATSYQDGAPVYTTKSRATYDVHGRARDTYDALDRRTTTTYTPATGLPTSVAVTNALSQTTTTTLDPAWGVPTAVVDPNGNRVDATYDALGRLTQYWGPMRSKARGQGPNTRHAYGLRTDGASWVSTQTLKPNGNYVTGYTLYDGFLRERQTQQPSPKGGRILTETLYNARGQVVRENAPYYNNQAPPGTTLSAAAENQVPAQTVTSYDGADRVTAQVYEKLNVEQWRTTTSYGGDHVTVVPPEGGTPATTYFDARDRVTEVREYRDGSLTGAYNRTRRTYTKSGELASITDTLGNQWRYTYDLDGNLVQTDDPDNGTTRRTYDAAGQLRTSTDARGQTVVYAYDPLGRATEVRQDTATGARLASWLYDTVAKGQLTSETRYRGADAYVKAVTGYSPDYRPTGEKTTIPATQGALAGSYSTTTTYLADGSIASVALPRLGDLSAETLVYRYDDLGLPTRVDGAQAYVTAATYTALGEPEQLQLGPDGTRLWQTSFYEEGTRRLSESAVQRESTSALDVDRVRYAYDPAGNVTQLETATEGTALDRQCFRYDGLRRLTEAWSTTQACTAAPGTAVGGPLPYWTSYRTDEIGRRTTETRHGLGGAADRTTTMTYPAAGQPRANAPLTVAGTTSGTYGYDAAGNTTSRPSADGTQTYTWDAEGQLSAVTVAGETTTYVNTPGNERLLAKDTAGTTVYLGGGELHLNQATGAVTGTRYYSQGGRAVAVRTAAGVDYLAADQQGTTTLAVDASTLRETKRRFDAFGVPRGAEPADWPGDRGFVGGADDDTTGMVRLGARDYDTATGKFIAADPVLDADNPQQLNAYSYANNNPTTFSDPTGRLLGVGAGIAGLGAPKPVGTGVKQAARSNAQAKKKAYRTKANTRKNAGYLVKARAKKKSQRIPYEKRVRAATQHTKNWVKGQRQAEVMEHAKVMMEFNAIWDNDIGLTISFCGGMSLPFGLGASGCVNLDTEGVSTSGQVQGNLMEAIRAFSQLTFLEKLVYLSTMRVGPEASVSVTFADATPGPSTSTSVSVPVRIGRLPLGVSVGRGNESGALSFGVTIPKRTGIGVTESYSYNFGYLFEW